MNPLELLLCSYVENHPTEAAHAFEKTDVTEAVRIIEKLPFRVAGMLLDRLTSQMASAILGRLDSSRTRDLLATMTPRHASLVLQYLEDKKREETLRSLPSPMERQLRELLSHPPDTAGGMMEPRVASIPGDLTAQDAIHILRKAPRQTLYYLYVTDREGRLIGVQLGPGTKL